MNPDSQLAHLFSTISLRAHQIWESLGKPHGRDVDIWLAAEKAIHAEHKDKPLPPVRIDNLDSLAPEVEAELSDINPPHSRSSTSFDVIH